MIIKMMIIDRLVEAVGLNFDKASRLYFIPICNLASLFSLFFLFSDNDDSENVATVGLS